MRIIFMGTPDFAAASLKALIESEHEILFVVTQPDKPKGRKGELTPSAVKTLALQAGIPVFQPAKVREESFVRKLKEATPDVIVVVAFGQIIPESILEIPKFGCINIHGSLLPKYRGAAPIQWAVLNGETETGITSMYMDKGLDTGDMLLKRTLTIDERETSGSLFEKMTALGATTLMETLEGIERGEITPEKQGETPTEYAKMLTRTMGEIDFGKTAKELDCFIRGMNPWPCAYTRFEGKSLKIWEAFPSEKVDRETAVGTIFEITKEGFRVHCKNGSLLVTEVQLEGKKRMRASDFLKGAKLEIGTVLGENNGDQ